MVYPQEVIETIREGTAVSFDANKKRAVSEGSEQIPTIVTPSVSSSSRAVSEGSDQTILTRGTSEGSEQNPAIESTKILSLTNSLEHRAHEVPTAAEKDLFNTVVSRLRNTILETIPENGLVDDSKLHSAMKQTILLLDLFVASRELPGLVDDSELHSAMKQTILWLDLFVASQEPEHCARLKGAIQDVMDCLNMVTVTKSARNLANALMKAAQFGYLLKSQSGFTSVRFEDRNAQVTFLDVLEQTTDMVRYFETLGVDILASDELTSDKAENFDISLWKALVEYKDSLSHWLAHKEKDAAVPLVDDQSDSQMIFNVFETILSTKSEGIPSLKMNMTSWGLVTFTVVPLAFACVAVADIVRG